MAGAVFKTHEDEGERSPLPTGTLTLQREAVEEVAAVIKARGLVIDRRPGQEDLPGPAQVFPEDEGADPQDSAKAPKKRVRVTRSV